jgi:hypothetical protein
VTHQPQSWNEANWAPTQVKRQHYVPRMYLKAFTGPDGKIRVVDLAENIDFRTSVENVPVRNYFNQHLGLSDGSQLPNGVGGLC